MEQMTQVPQTETKEVIEKNDAEPSVVIDDEKVKRYVQNLKMEQNLPFGIIGGAAASLICAAIWAAVTISSGFQIGWMAVGVGFIVGYAVKFTGKGMDKVFGVVGAVFSLLGCLIGNLFSIIGFAANEEGISFFEILNQIDYSVIPSVMIETFSPMDILFYGIAVYEGYRFSFRNVSEQDILTNAAV